MYEHNISSLASLLAKTQTLIKLFVTTKHCVFVFKYIYIQRPYFSYRQRQSTFRASHVNPSVCQLERHAQ